MHKRLRDVMMPRAAGYWTTYYTFGGKRHKENPFLIGQNRAADIVINVVLPVVSAYAQQWRGEELKQDAMEVYAEHPKLQDNKITRYVAHRIFHNRENGSSVVNSAMRQQGLIHLYKLFCAEQNCQRCPLMEESS
jgi:hypothetical protein